MQYSFQLRASPSFFGVGGGGGGGVSALSVNRVNRAFLKRIRRDLMVIAGVHDNMKGNILDRVKEVRRG